MSIDQIPEYTGNVPVIGQEQNEFNANTKDQLDFFNQQAVNINTFATQANALGDSVEVSEQNAASSALAAESAAASSGYKGLWDDGVSSAIKGDLWQTQTAGSPDGRYFTALVDTSVDPTGDNVNWRDDLASNDRRYAQNSAVGNGYIVSLEGRVMISDLNGSRVSGGKLFTYELGTTTPKATYTAKELTSQNANPVILDGDGLGDIFIGDSYTMVLKTSGDVTLWTMNVFNPNLKNYNQLSQGVTKIALQAKSLIHKQIIITGDSLSFNGYDYPAGWPVVGSGYATDQPLGISPWSALIRDSIIASNGFQSIKDLKMVTTCDISLPNSTERAYYGLNSVVAFLTPDGSVYDGSDSTTLVSEFAGSQGLLISTRPSGTGASFELNGVTVSTDSDDDQNLGFGYKIVPFTPESNQFCNIENIQGAPLAVYGIVPSGIKIPKITGKGQWTSTQIFAEYDDLVAPYNPDVLFYIIGANDAGLGGPDVSGYNTSVQSFIDRAKLDNPNVEIILISMPPVSSYTADRTMRYVRAGYNIALKNNCSHVDLYHELLNYPTADWRFDNIHCNTNGDTIWFNIFKQLLFPGLDVPEIYQPIREYFAFPFQENYRKPDSLTCSVQLTAGAPTLTASNGFEYESKITLEYELVSGIQTCKVTLPKHYTMTGVEGLILSSGQANTVRFNKNIQGNVFTVIALGVGDNVAINPDGSGLFFIFSATTDFK